MITVGYVNYGNRHAIAAPGWVAMNQPGTKVGELCAELGVTRQTLYRHVGPMGVLRPHGNKLFGHSTRRSSPTLISAQARA